MVVKIKTKQKKRCILTLLLGSLGFVHKTQHCDNYFSALFISLNPFSRIVWTNRLHDFDEGICFPNNCCYGKR